MIRYVGLPHADIIGIESHREFGLSALEYIDGCMQRRGGAFRQSSVQDIASWNAASGATPATYVATDRRVSRAVCRGG